MVTSPVLVHAEDTEVYETHTPIELDHPHPPPPPGPLVITGGFGSWTLIVTMIGRVVPIPSETT